MTSITTPGVLFSFGDQKWEFYLRGGGGVIEGVNNFRAEGANFFNICLAKSMHFYALQ